MFADVVERFLNDAIERGLNFLRNIGGSVLTGLNVHVDCAVGGPCFDEIVNRLDQAEVIKRGWTQFKRHAMKISRGLRGQFLKWQHYVLKFLRRGVVQRLETEIEHGQVLTHLIV